VNHLKVAFLLALPYILLNEKFRLHVEQTINVIPVQIVHVRPILEITILPQQQGPYRKKHKEKEGL
jgi:hypothetical protein